MTSVATLIFAVAQPLLCPNFKGSAHSLIVEGAEFTEKALSISALSAGSAEKTKLGVEA